MTSFMKIVIGISLAGLLISYIFAFIRLCKGPTLADRVISLDLIAFITIGFIGIYSIVSNQKAFMDIAITLALVAFLSTVAFARFIYKREDKSALSTEHLDTNSHQEKS